MKCVFCSEETENDRLWLTIKCVKCSKSFVNVENSDNIRICDDCFVSKKNQHNETEHGSVDLV